MFVTFHQKVYKKLMSMVSSLDQSQERAHMEPVRKMDGLSKNLEQWVGELGREGVWPGRWGHGELGELRL